MSFSLAKGAEKDLDEIADAVGEEQGIDASRSWIDAVTIRFDALGARPRMGRTRDHDLGPGRAGGASCSGATSSSTGWTATTP